MNKLKLLLITGLLAVFPTSLFADGIKVLNAQRAMLSTQYAQDEFTKLDQDADFIADRERLELLQTEGQALVEKFSRIKKLFLMKKLQICKQSYRTSRLRYSS